MELTEVAPGIDIERHILAHMGFRPIIREPRSMDARINRGLHGYTVRIGKLRLQPIGGALTLEGMEVRRTPIRIRAW